MTRALLIVFLNLLPYVCPAQSADVPPSRILLPWKVEKDRKFAGSRPIYPPLAISVRLEGCVRIQFVIAKEGGSPHDVEVLSGHPLLIQSAIDSVRTWRFQEVRLNGSLVEVETIAYIHFLLPGNTLEKYLAPYRKAAERRPTDRRARADLAYALSNMGEMEESVLEFQRTLGVWPNDGNLHFGLGHALVGQGQLDAAINEYRRGLQIDSQGARFHFELADILEKTKQLKEATAEHHEGLRLTPKEGYRHTNFGVFLMRTGDLDTAIKEFREAIRLEHDNPTAHFQLGKALEKKGDLQLALQEYQTASKLLPSFDLYVAARDALSSKIKAQNQSK